jgi:hypothetical protein
MHIYIYTHPYIHVYTHTYMHALHPHRLPQIIPCRRMHIHIHKHTNCTYTYFHVEYHKERKQFLPMPYLLPCVCMYLCMYIHNMHMRTYTHTRYGHAHSFFIRSFCSSATVPDRGGPRVKSTVTGVIKHLDLKNPPGSNRYFVFWNREMTLKILCQLR